MNGVTMIELASTRPGNRPAGAPRPGGQGGVDNQVVRGLDRTPAVTDFLESLALLGEPFHFGIDNAEEFFAASGLTATSRTAAQNGTSLDHPIFSRYRFHTLRRP
jgi:hypothetical protein